MKKERLALGLSSDVSFFLVLRLDSRVRSGRLRQSERQL